MHLLYKWCHIGHTKVIIFFFLSFIRCVQPSDDPFRSCFGCDDELDRKDGKHGYSHHYSYVNRQTGEEFQATSQSRRVVCGNVGTGGRSCRLRIDRAMQLRMVSYGKALQFIQSEQYLSDDDLSFIQRKLFL